jgi:hypothetical protein
LCLSRMGAPPPPQPHRSSFFKARARRFGKTFAVSMFAAAMLYSTPSLELSIYSTCKRISQKLMRNVTRFLELIYKDKSAQPMPVIRSNMEEVVLQGPDGVHDVRTVNSYPSKVRRAAPARTLEKRQTTLYFTAPPQVRPPPAGRSAWAPASWTCPAAAAYSPYQTARSCRPRRPPEALPAPCSPSACRS